MASWSCKKTCSRSPRPSSQQQGSLCQRACDRSRASLTVSQLTAQHVWSWRAHWTSVRWLWSRWTTGTRWTPEEKQKDTHPDYSPRAQHTTIHPSLRGCQFPTYLMALQFLIQKENPIKHMHEHRKDTKLHTQSRKMDMGLSECPGVTRTVSMAGEQRPQQAHKPHPAILPQVAMILNIFFYCAGGYDKLLLITYVHMILLSH